MELGSGLRAYGRLLSYPRAAHPFLAAVIGRLPVAMAPIGLLLMIQHERQAYGIAGLVTGAFAIGSAFGMPLWGRMMDRVGQPRVLVATAAVSSAALVATALATVGGAGDPLLLALALVAGLSFPPLSPAMRSAWRVIFPDRASRRVAFALDGTVIELIFVLGPLLLSLLLFLFDPVLPMYVTAALLLIGNLAYASTEAARTAVRTGAQLAEAGGVNSPAAGPLTLDEPRPADPPVRSSSVGLGVVTVFTMMAVLSVGFGQLDTSMAATSERLFGSTDRVGFLFAFIAGGSTIGGLTYGARHWKVSERHAIPALLAAFAALLGVLSLVVRNPELHAAVIFGVLFVTGLTIAPTLIMQQSLVDHLAPPDRLNEAQGLLSASNTTGAALGTAIAGLVIDAHGVSASFFGASLALLVGVVVALCSQRLWLRALERGMVDHPAQAPSTVPS